jgi:MarR family 2-MHQ and catechol resistance regulon transcriptional repressor
MPTHYSGTTQEVAALNAFIKLTRSVEALAARLSRSSVLEGLTLSQFGALETLYHLGPMCQSELGEKLLRSGGNITLVVDNLEKRDLVKRQRVPDDRRMIRVSLTEAGQELIKRVFPSQMTRIVGEMSILSIEELETLGALCKKLGKSQKA